MLGADEIALSWLRRLPQTPGGYAEAILPGWREAVPTNGGPERTSLSQLRLAYVLLHAGSRGVEGALAAGRAALNRACQVFWRGGLRGWIRSADERGLTLDATVDTYDQAFGLLACSWDREPGSGGSAAADGALRLARDALAGLDEDAADAVHGGYRELRNGAEASRMVRHPGLRRQNPHMHLLEAFLSWSSIDPSGPWLDRASAIKDLLLKRFIDPASGALREYFDDAWGPAPGEPGRILEPGHHFEWVWLLSEYRKVTGDAAVLGPARALYHSAVRTGVDGDGLAFDAIDLHGSVVSGTKLLWPQAEQLKAHLAMYEWTGDAAALAAARRLLGAMQRLYIGDGLFTNQLDREGLPVPAPTPSRVLYHLFLALVEAERVLADAP
jgi:mannose/cellobiose epimerase-like protein (N-acyl-D-glucosamine 2-epimerase family)